jgi:prepilin-type processing-associated H-X9-DG protein
MVPNDFVYFVTGPGSSMALGSDSSTWCRSIAPLDTNEIDEASSMLFIYNRSPAIYHCPADRSTVKDMPEKLRNRSYNMSNSINNHISNHYRKYSLIKSPTSLFVFIDTHENAIWDSTFGVFSKDAYYSDYWIDIPADRHNRGANISYADGHAETMRWRTPKGELAVGQRALNSEDLADLRELQERIKGSGGN